MRTILSSRVVMVLLVGGSVMLADTASAQGWKPERNVELTIPTSPGGSNDIAGRIIHKLWNELKLLPVASSVANRSGGEHIVAYTYIQQRAGDPHVIGIMSTPMLVNPIEGRTQLTHNDLTPIAYLITEPMVAVVRADSPIQNGKDLVEALRKNPGALSIALTSNRAPCFHRAAAAEGGGQRQGYPDAGIQGWRRNNYRRVRGARGRSDYLRFDQRASRHRRPDARHRGELDQAARRSHGISANVAGARLPEFRIVERCRRAQGPHPCADRVLGGSDAKDSAKRRDTPVRRKEPVAHGVQGERGYAQMAG
jgi:hypothetical protein